jgi:hypothetical protein
LMLKIGDILTIRSHLNVPADIWFTHHVGYPPPCLRKATRFFSQYKSLLLYASSYVIKNVWCQRLEISWPSNHLKKQPLNGGKIKTARLNMWHLRKQIGEFNQEISTITSPLLHSLFLRGHLNTCQKSKLLSKTLDAISRVISLSWCIAKSQH